MKRFVVVVAGILLLALACIYLFIPSNLTIQQTVLVKATKDGLTRKLSDENGWTSWWPGSIENNGRTRKYHYGHSSFSLDKQTVGSIILSAGNEKVSCSTALNMINTKVDTTEIIWTGSIPTSANPFKRVQAYFASNHLVGDMDGVLHAIQSHFSKTENVYDFNIRYDGVVDTFLLTTSAELKSYPSTEFIYQLIDNLNKYISHNGARATGSPMLNVSTNDSVTYLTRVAVPVNRILFSQDGIRFKRMPAGGNILVVDIKGGPNSINKAFTQVQNFVSDYHETAPAIPFFSLVTDRRMVVDTSEWITRIYYPIM